MKAPDNDLQAAREDHAWAMGALAGINASEAGPDAAERLRQAAYQRQREALPIIRQSKGAPSR